MMFILLTFTAEADDKGSSILMSYINSKDSYRRDDILSGTNKGNASFFVHERDPLCLVTKYGEGWKMKNCCQKRSHTKASRSQIPLLE